MSINSFGHLFRVTTWGESHGPAIGAVIDGCPPGLALDASVIQPWLDRRRPGESRFVSQRREPDAVRILSGVFEGRTTGTPISLMIDNADAWSSDYAADAPFRPGHADYAYLAKYGLRDHRGGGRASARETACRVAAGAVARLVIPEVTIAARLVEVGGVTDESHWDDILDAVREAGDSCGAIVECVATGVAAGWGAPVYAKLDTELAAACMSVNAVKGVEIGTGFAAARMRGSAAADAMRPSEGGGVEFLTNHSGGIAGGIATGQPIVVRAAFKPTSSIAVPGESVDRAGRAVNVSTVGRHDPCVGIRGAPVIEAMVALVLADHKLLHRGQCGGT